MNYTVNYTTRARTFARGGSIFRKGISGNAGKWRAKSMKKPIGKGKNGNIKQVEAMHKRWIKCGYPSEKQAISEKLWCLANKIRA